MSLLDGFPDPHRDDLAQRTADAEQVLLGAMLWPDTARPTAAPKLADHEWQEGAHRTIGRAIWDLRGRGIRPDPALVASAVAADPDVAVAGGVAYLRDLIRAAPATGDEVDCARAVLGLARKRALYLASQELATLALEPGLTAPDALARARPGLDALAVGDAPTGRTLRDVVRARPASLLAPLRCDPTGLPALDDALLGGLYPGKLYGIAARMKIGKTALMTTVATNVARRGGKVLFVAGEMGGEEIGDRIAARELDLNAAAFLKRPADKLAEMVAAYAEDAPWLDNILFEDRPGITRGDHRRLVSMYRHSHKIDGVVTDYWQLVGGRQREQTEVSHLTDTAQEWANDAKAAGDYWHLTAAQINRDGDTRGGDGLKMACSMYLHLHAVDIEGRPTRFWLDMENTRYTPKKPVGSKEQPPLFMHRVGPHVAQEGVEGDRRAAP